MAIFVNYITHTHINTHNYTHACIVIKIENEIIFSREIWALILSYEPAFTMGGRSLKKWGSISLFLHNVFI